MSNKNDVYSSLPQRCLEGVPTVSDPNNFVIDLLKKELPKCDSKSLTCDLKWQFLLNKLSKRKNTSKPSKRKRAYLTRKLRKDMGLVKLPKNDWNYESLENMREMWRQYMKSNLELAGNVPNCRDQDWSSFSLILARSELIGGDVKVVRSKVPSQVGMQGTIVLETKMTFQIVTPESQLKIIPKETSVFQFLLDNLKFTVFGKHIVAKPSERSVKKIKSQMSPDL